MPSIYLWLSFLNTHVSKWCVYTSALLCLFYFFFCLLIGGVWCAFTRAEHGGHFRPVGRIEHAKVTNSQLKGEAFLVREANKCACIFIIIIDCLWFRSTKVIL